MLHTILLVLLAWFSWELVTYVVVSNRFGWKWPAQALHNARYIFRRLPTSPPLRGL